MITGMLRLGRALESEMRRVPVDLGRIAREVAAGLRTEDPSRSVELVVRGGLSACGDPALLHAVMSNLLGNAWKFTAHRDEARVEVGRQRNAGESVFYVRDNGAGFDMRYADKLFAVFQRLHSRDEFAGDGVGLATVERIISRHGGRIWAEGRPNQGATFFFTLPEP